MAQSRTRSTLNIILILGLCIFCYILGSWKKSNIGRGDLIAQTITKQTECDFPLTLNFETHHTKAIFSNQTLNSTLRIFEPCDEKYTDYTPCQDQKRAMFFPRKNMVYRERHCSSEADKMYCLIPAPKGYVTPYHWPKSRDYVPFVNVPYRSLTVEKAVQNWIQFEGNVFRFPGGGTQFPLGADQYIDQLASVIPIENGTIRTVLDTGCGVASFGAYLFSRNVLTMSFAPHDSHEAQVQFALERGIPAVIGVLGSMKLPYPSRSFDMAHCSQCLVPWTSNDGMYMMEIDRVLRPGGYWVLSGPPINWKNHYKSWNRTMKDLEAEHMKIEELAELLCWEKISEMGEMATWRKPINIQSCHNRKWSHVKTCDSANPDDVWYKEMEVCKTPNPTFEPIQLEPFPKRLYAIPPRIAASVVPRVSPNMYRQDSKLWRKRVEAYKRINNFVGTNRYRNVMDMNAGIGGFGAAMGVDKLWVMNVVPTIADTGMLGVIYERGMIGIYHDWCEAFSTYPRTYDLIHANGIFSLYQDSRCKIEDILLEMDRILRPEGAVIIRESIDLLTKVGSITNGMRWDCKIVDHEDGPHSSEKVLFAVKKYWVGGSRNIENEDDRI